MMTAMKIYVKVNCSIKTEPEWNRWKQQLESNALTRWQLNQTLIQNIRRYSIN